MSHPPRSACNPKWTTCNFAAAGYAEWGGLGWAIRFIDGVKVVEHGGLRRLVTFIDPTGNGDQTFSRSLLMPLSERDFVVVTQDENEGSQVDFIEGNDGAVHLLRMDGRLYDRLTEEAPR